MNILFVHTHGIIPTSGGISRTTANLGELFKKRGHEVWYVALINKNESHHYDNHQMFFPDSDGYSSKNVDFLCKIIEEYGIAIIINQVPFSDALVSLIRKCSLRTGAKIISCYHNSILTPVINYAYCQEYKLKTRHRNWLFKTLKCKPVARLLVSVYILKWRRRFNRASYYSDAVVLLCDGQVDEWLCMCGHKKNSKATVIPNYATTPSGHIQYEKKKNVLWVGSFDYAIKRPDLMLLIWKKVERKHPDWRLYMLGDGPSLSEMKTLAQQLKLENVVFPGRVNPSAYYRVAQIQCVTSVHEAFPMVPIESMTERNPVIAFNSYTSASFVIIDQKNGILVKPFDTDAYAKQLSDLMNDDVKRKSMGEYAKDSVTRFSSEKVYALWKQLFERVKVEEVK